jgi:N,N'-diacetyllegionaminate synthase
MGLITVAAEVGMAHDGDWTKVEQYAKAAKACGVDVLKLQCHLPEESSELEQWRVDPGTGETRLAYWARTAWDVPTWRKVGRVIHEHGLRFGCSVFCLEAVELMRHVPELDVWKVPSGVAHWEDLRKAIYNDPRNVWISSGLDGHGAAHWFGFGLPMNCTSLYPCPPEHSGLGWANDEWGHEFGSGIEWGWSDHTGDPALIYAAIGAGATVVEVHFEINSGWTTPDTDAAWDEIELRELVQGIRRIEQGLASTGKDKIAAACAHLRPFYVPTRYNGRIAKHGGKGEPI